MLEEPVLSHFRIVTYKNNSLDKEVHHGLSALLSLDVQLGACIHFYKLILDKLSVVQVIRPQRHTSTYSPIYREPVIPERAQTRV